MAAGGARVSARAPRGRPSRRGTARAPRGPAARRPARRRRARGPSAGARRRASPAPGRPGRSTRRGLRRQVSHRLLASSAPPARGEMQWRWERPSRARHVVDRAGDGASHDPLAADARRYRKHVRLHRGQQKHLVDGEARGARPAERGIEEEGDRLRAEVGPELQREEAPLPGPRPRRRRHRLPQLRGGLGGRTRLSTPARVERSPCECRGGGRSVRGVRGPCGRRSGCSPPVSQTSKSRSAARTSGCASSLRPRRSTPQGVCRPKGSKSSGGG